MRPSELLAAYGITKRIAPGGTVFREGDPAGTVYGLISGRLRIEVTTPTGGRLVIAIKEPGDLVGELGALDGRPRSATAVALDEVELVHTSADQFLEILETEPTLSVGLLRRLSEDLRRSVNRTTRRASADTTQRVAMLLFDLAERYGEHDGREVSIDLSLTQDDLAGWVGATREATARSLRSLRERSCVTTGRRQISISNVDELRLIALG